MALKYLLSNYSIRKYLRLEQISVSDHRVGKICVSGSFGIGGINCIACNLQQFVSKF